jgi:hypothetical protein
MLIRRITESSALSLVLWFNLRYVIVEMIPQSEVFHGASGTSHTFWIGSPRSGEVVESVNLTLTAGFKSYLENAPGKKYTVKWFNFRLAQYRPYNLLSLAWSAFFTKPASPNTTSVTEPGTEPNHFDFDSPQDQISSDLTLCICVVVLKCPTANSLIFKNWKGKRYF